MKREFVLRKLSQLLEWDEDRDLKEFPWLRMMSALKFDEYQDFLAGARFIECLLDWLQQFPTASDRAVAYDFVRKKLLFVSAAEIQHLVELFYLEEIERRLLSIVATKLSVPTYRVWSHPEGPQQFRRTLRSTLFIGLSDGARMDAFRRANAGIISNEQIVVYPRINAPKWRELLMDLRDEQGPDTKFEVVYLIDDFTASGTSLLRKPDPSKGWKGKVAKFFDDIKDRLDDVEGSPSIRQGCLSDEALVVPHHYLATDKARKTNEQSIRDFCAEMGARERFASDRVVLWPCLPVRFCARKPGAQWVTGPGRSPLQSIHRAEEAQCRIRHFDDQTRICGLRTSPSSWNTTPRIIPSR